MSQYDYTKGYNYDLFDDNTMFDTSSIAGGPGIYTVGTGGGGLSGQALTWNDVNAVWADTITTTTNLLHVKGDAEIEGDLKVKGKSLADAIDNIEKRLAILHPNQELEERWDQLKALRKQYIELEKDLLEKEKLMKILKEK